MSIFRRRPSGPVASPFSFDAHDPERVAKEAKLAYGTQQFAEAMRTYERAIDLLHTLYLFDNMRQRQPSPADAWIVDGYVNALGAALAMDAATPVEASVRTVTHRLRTIATACDHVGAPSQLYRNALAQMAVDASHVRVDDVFG